MTTGTALKKRAKRVMRRMGFDIIKAKRFPANEIHFLHIGKNAGTQIKRLSEEITRQYPDRPIVTHTHDFFYKLLPPSSQYFFSIREPISRFRSGFYSRKRKGYPTFDVDWNDHERIAFEEFEHANDLAESLFSEGELGNRAFAAMKSLRHTAQNQSDWFYIRGNFLRLSPPIWIIRQESFKADFEVFLKRASYDLTLDGLQGQQDKVAVNRGDYSNIPPISEKGQENLRRWYAQDIAFYQLCDDWLEAQTP
ncbi:hypothetical protein [Rhodovulum adriaticum]|uniref:Sulfotransferase family protein n=1 Tax=Rhodovulum adriaticum TaxID=35804 RepID=A0A4R2NY88_RHOAD|nr:hypothetical protein [Rhodovulum adriaticum]MBK1634210.1 hypothetical protein [Rhodovulum adriaticum]TCP27239.1 hypothetical protein EV656_101142 [Rhodovulum adriaticum]